MLKHRSWYSLKFKPCPNSSINTSLSKKRWELTYTSNPMELRSKSHTLSSSWLKEVNFSISLPTQALLARVMLAITSDNSWKVLTTVTPIKLLIEILNQRICYSIIHTI